MAAKSKPLSIRLSPDTDELISAEARRTRRSRGAVVEALAEEALRARRFPGIAFRGADWNRRPWVIGTGLDVWEIVRASGDFESPAAMVAETDLDERHVRLALAYADEFSDEVEAAIQDSDRSVEQLRREFPSIDVFNRR